MPLSLFCSRPSHKLFAALLLVLGILICATYPGTAQKNGETARIVRIYGTVEYKAAGTSAWRPANNRQTIHQGDSLKTGKDAYAIVELSDRNNVRLLSETDFTFKSMRADESYSKTDKVLIFFPAAEKSQHYEVDLNEGGALSVLRGLSGNSSYDLSTPVAVAGVRGTVFAAVVTKKSAALSALDEYSDGAKGQAGSQQVTANFFCFEGALQMSGVGGGGLGMIPAGQGAAFTGTPAPGGGGAAGGGAPRSGAAPSGGGGTPPEGDGGDGGEGGTGGQEGGAVGGGAVATQAFTSVQQFASSIQGALGGGSLAPTAGGLLGDIQEIANTTNPTTNTGNNPNTQDNPAPTPEPTQRTPICTP